ncbi:MFS transporter [Corynebacterium halotolerans]|uniref:Shikimate transport protein ShiA n=1 Tax=Corynebacterium halotolerans YIM 70093 = DSM 44683 TaxID=1121362 RepID=M1N0Y3_9CORY|nr:MFS transporter [Corynebacterium halotolerans]AGF73579.1 shikimate transport protein ShiA [Corynebacterium halotolerans YIM 70093 = DSM 44683]
MTTQAPASGHRKTPKKAALSGWIGSALEYYDFAVYGTAAALVLNQLFFPEDTAPGVAILASMATVGIAYIVRPLGALIMGPLADRFGRKFVLMLCLFMIGASTFIVGCLPTFDQVGYLAPALLVICRVIQGLSASGEQASAISVSLEHSTEHRRALTASWTLHGTQFGTLLATAVFIPFTLFLSEEALMSWGWRVPFWLSAVVVLVAFLIRRGLEEPPAFREVQESQANGEAVRGPSPLALTLRYHKAAVARVAVAAMINTVNVVFTVWSLSFATNVVGLDRSTMLLVPVAANVVALLAIPLSGALADRLGRRPVFVIGAIGSAVAMGGYLNAIYSANWTAIFIVGVVMSGLFYSMSNAVWPAFYAEMFPTPVRVTGLALGTQIGFAVSGGFAPVLASALAGAEGDNWLGVGIFVGVVSVIAAVAGLTAKETRNHNLDEIDALHTARGEATDLARAGVEAGKERRTTIVVEPDQPHPRRTEDNNNDHQEARL